MAIRVGIAFHVSDAQTQVKSADLSSSKILPILGTSDMICLLMRVIARRTLKEHWLRRVDSEQPLKAWFHEARKAAWKSPADVKSKYRTASLLRDGRCVFNVGGNKY